ncbi:MAG: winged helix-turn-helix domain-containing protein [Xanthomonadales bacterium]|nr:winged helix-turn-helix domain-containing protein [Xanthomonadales bacterium]
MGFECYSIGDLLLDAGTQEVTRDGVVVPVPRLSFKLLLSLARHAPNVVTTQQLENEVWEGLVVDRGTVNKRVLLLRRSLSKDSGEDPYVAVIRGSGYRLVVPVKRVDHVPDELAKEEKSPQNWYQRSADTIRTTSFWLLGIVAVLALFQGFRNTSIESVEPRVEENPSGELMVVPAVYSRTSIAVLPFVDLSDSQAHHYLGDGVAEEVINLLAGMEGLKVAARTSSFAFRETSATLVEIASKLKVGTILEGSVRHSGDRIRVTAQLIDARNGYHIWSQNYDRDFNQVFAVQDDIAFNIAQTLKLTLDESNQPDSSKSMTADMEAFKLYLKGRDLLNDRIKLRTDGLYEALDYFNQAIVQDPKFARAHAGVANINWLLTSYDASLDREVWYEKAEASAKFALEIDPDSIEAMGALAAVYSKRGDLEHAAELFDRIRSIDGSKSDIISWEATLHIRLGYFEELIHSLSREYRLDPLNEHIAWALADALIYSGKPAEAIVILKKLQHFSYRDYYLALAAIYSGTYETARVLLPGVKMRSGRMPAVYAGLLIDALEDPARKEEVVRKIISATQTGKLDKLIGFESLLILGSPGAFDLGIDPVEGVKNLQLHAQVWNNWAVEFRQDPRFKDWVRALGYVEFWRKYGWPDRCRPTGLNDFECI